MTPENVHWIGITVNGPCLKSNHDFWKQLQRFKFSTVSVFSKETNIHPNQPFLGAKSIPILGPNVLGGFNDSKNWQLVEKHPFVADWWHHLRRMDSWSPPSLTKDLISIMNGDGRGCSGANIHKGRPICTMWYTREKSYFALHIINLIGRVLLATGWRMRLGVAVYAAPALTAYWWHTGRSRWFIVSAALKVNLGQGGWEAVRALAIDE